MKSLDKSTYTLIYIITVATGLALVALFAFTRSNLSMITAQNKQYLEDVTEKMAENLDSQIQNGYESIEVVAKLLSAGRTNKDVDVNQLREYMDGSIFDFVEFADVEGWNHNALNTRTYAGDREYYLNGVLHEQTGMEVIYFSRATHETLLSFYSPVYCNETEVIGVVIGVYQAANKITELLTDDFFGTQGTAYLATEKGRIIASSGEYDPSAEKYVSSLDPGGEKCELEYNGWQLIHYFPEQVTKDMVTKANLFGYLLSLFLLMMGIVDLAAVISYLRKRHKKHQEELQGALSQAENANKAKTTFLNNMSHDIRTPLNAITGFNRIALNTVGTDDEKVKDCLQKVDKSSEALLTIINDILEISRIESGKISLSQDMDDVYHSFDGIASMMTEMAAKSKIDISFEFGEIQDRFVICDIAHTNRILTNLASNAIKYTKEGGWVKLRCEQEGRDGMGRGVYRYTIQDNGIGISDEFKKELFNPFAREQSSTVNKIQGTGLGLAMCKDLVDLMGGRISCKSRQGEGTTFTVILPFGICDTQMPDLKENIENRDDQVSFSGKHILVVDDNDLNREISSAVLEEFGCIVHQAVDGDEAVHMMSEAKTGDIDLVLMDIMMPTIDGYEATRRIRALGTEISRIPIVAMTANAFEEDRKTALDAGMDGHLAKPVDLDKLSALLSRFLGRK